jgi:hypothetical protein
MAFYMKMGSKSHKASGINMNGTPLKKCGDPGELPCTQPSQATADAAAEKSVDNANRVYNDDFKETGRTKVPGGTEVSFSRNYNQTGTGEATKSYTQLAKEGGDVEAARKWNAERSKSGTETKTRMITDPIKINPAGFDLPSMQPETETLIPLTPKKITYTPVDAPDKELQTSSSGSSTTNKYKPGKQKKNGRSLTGAKIEDFFTVKGRCPGGC